MDLRNYFIKEDVSTYIKADAKLERGLGVRDLIALGVGAVIGTGIFILPGHEAANHAGPAVTIAFVIAAVVSGMAGMAYAEMSSAMPVAGSAYSFGSVIYGEIIGFLLGWSLILEYFLASAAIATGFSAYFNNNLLSSINIHLPNALLSGPGNPENPGGVINITAVLIVLIVGLIISRGLNAFKRIENFSVVIKVAIIMLFIIIGFFFIKTDNYIPFYPKEFRTGLLGTGGIAAAAASVFFAFIGFDTLAAHSAEVKNPGKNMFRGILGTVLVSGLLYVLFAFVMVGIVPYPDLGVDDPAAYVLQAVGHPGWAKIITVGALVGMFSAILSITAGASRLIYSIGRDGLLPKKLGDINSNGAPQTSVVVTIIVIAIFAGLVPLDELAHLVNAGTLIAFITMSFGIISLRRRKDIINTGFKMPGYPVLPIISGILPAYFLWQLPDQAKLWTLAWITAGIICYVLYGYSHSNLQKRIQNNKSPK